MRDIEVRKPKTQELTVQLDKAQGVLDEALCAISSVKKETDSIRQQLSAVSERLDRLGALIDEALMQGANK